MIKKLLFFSLSFILLFYPKESLASSLVKIDKDGNLVVNVLSAEDSLALGLPQKNYLEVKEIAGRSPENNDVILKREDDKYNLYLGESRALDITNWRDSVVEIEEKEDAKKVDVLLSSGKFVIKQSGLLASVDYPLRFKPKEKELLVETPLGEKLVFVMPYEAALTALRSRVVSKVSKDSPFELVEENKDLIYRIKGAKTLNFFGFYQADFPVDVKISASTGEVVFVDEPWWLRLAGFFLV